MFPLYFLMWKYPIVNAINLIYFACFPAEYPLHSSMQSNVHICHLKCWYDLLHFSPNFFCDKFGKSDKICPFEQTISSKQINNLSGFWITCIIETWIENNKNYSEINSLPSGLDLSTSPKSEVCVYITSDQVAIDGK